jgi:hypothetical protein
MNIPAFNQSNKNDSSNEGESVRLSNELRYKPEKIIKNIQGVIIDTIPEKSGFDIETASFGVITNFLETESLSKSLESFIHRILSIRFENEYRDYIVNDDFVTEKSLIISNSKNDVEWFGEVGYFGKTRLDKSIDNKIHGFKAKVN